MKIDGIRQSLKKAFKLYEITHQSQNYSYYFRLANRNNVENGFHIPNSGSIGNVLFEILS